MSSLDPMPRILRTRSLKADGWTDRRLRAAVENGRLLRLRDGAFCLPGIHSDLIEAGCHRGRLACLSALRLLDVFVLETPRLHLHVPPTASRLRPAVRHRVHRRQLLRMPHPDDLMVEPVDAIRDALVCQQPRSALATLDSALHAGVVTRDDLPEILDSLPDRYGTLARLADPRAESGSETFMRLILRTLDCSFTPQVTIGGVGRVDFLVDGWLIVECDSESHHGGWEAQRADRRRDLAAAALGFTTIRPIAEDIFWNAGIVRRAVTGLLSARASQKQDDS